MLKLAFYQEACAPAHDHFALILSSGLCVGIVISYLPQHIRIIANKTSEGLSPLFLLLGSTSSAAGMLNVVILQWPFVQCCAKLSTGSCFENIVGILQVFLQWFLFSVIVVLYLLYFPQHVKYAESRPVPPSGHPEDCDCHHCVASRSEALLVTTGEWKEAVALCSVVAIHLVTCLFVTFFVVLSAPSSEPTPGQPLSRAAELWAGFLGVSSMILAAWQYTPQLYKTYNAKLVGALSIPTMCIQTPGSVLFVISLAIREGTNWTSWLTYAVTGVLQGSLLVMCLFWRRRQKRLRVDDFGNSLDAGDTAEPEAVFHLPTPPPENFDAGQSEGRAAEDSVDESTPLMLKGTEATGKLYLPTFFRRGR